MPRAPRFPSIGRPLALLLGLAACATTSADTECAECEALRQELARRDSLLAERDLPPAQASLVADTTDAEDQPAEIAGLAPPELPSPDEPADDATADLASLDDPADDGAVGPDDTDELVDDLGDEPAEVDSSWRRFTQVNLHPDSQRRRLYSVNYQQDGLIPAGSEVELIRQTRKAMRFRVVESGEEYDYRHHAAIREPFADHLESIFGRSWEPDWEAFSEVDHQGIEEGTALEGMSKSAVLVAMGPPPSHHTPDLDGDRWRYWTNRFNTIAVLFDEDGLVTDVVE